MTPDVIETNAAIRWVCQLLDLHSHSTFVVVCILALIAVFVFKDLFLIFQYYVQARFVYNNRFATQQQLLHIYLTKPYEYFLHAKSGEILRTIQNDIEKAFSLLMTLLGMVAEMIVSFVLAIAIFVIDPLMTCFVAAMLLVIMAIIAKAVRPTLQKKGTEFYANAAQTNKWLLQAVNGIKEVKVTAKESFFEENFNTCGQRMIHAERINSVFGNIPRLLIEMSAICSTLLVIAVMIYRGRPIETLVPSLGVFAMAAVRLMPSANRIVSALNSIAYSEYAVDRLIENFQSFGEISKVESNKSAPKEAAELTLKNSIALHHISFRYPDGEENILTDSEMVIPVGSSVGIVGKSGAGKTTAVDILLGLLTPQKGQILADGVDVMSNYPNWLSHIGYIPQSIFMLDDSIRANVAFGIHPEDMDDTQVWRALEEAQLADFVRTLPNGLDTQIGERGVRLSGGQRQRLGIARALYTDPELLIFDEATSALDNETESSVMEAINSLQGKKTMVIIAHRLQTIENCDMVYRVENGTIQRER